MSFFNIVAECLPIQQVLLQSLHISKSQEKVLWEAGGRLREVVAVLSILFFHAAQYCGTVSVHYMPECSGFRHKGDLSQDALYYTGMFLTGP